MSFQSCQEKSVRQECADEQAAPSEKVVQMQRSAAVSAWGGLQDDEDLLPMAALSSSANPVPGNEHAGGGVTTRSANFKGRAASTAATSKTSSKTKNPIAEAASQRARTMKEWKNSELQLKKAIQNAESLLNTDAVEIHGSAEKATQDPSLQLIQERLEIARLAVDRSEAGSIQKNRLLYQLCLKDPYLKDLQDSLLSSQDGVQSVAWIDHIRSSLLDIQPTAEKVQQLMDLQRNALAVLSKIASSLIKETETWKANVAALKKAKREEEKAALKAEQALAKEEERKAKKADAARQRAEQKKRREEEAAEEAAKEKDITTEKDDAVEEGDEKGRRRVPRATKAKDLTEDDPAVLRTLRNAGWLTPTVTHGTLEAFVEHVTAFPHLPTIARLRKGSVKKVLQVTCSTIWKLLWSVKHCCDVVMS